MICFRKVKEPYGWLSNMSPHPVGGYRTAEAMFQASRFDNEDIINDIRDCTSPMGAKFQAKSAAAHMVVVPRSEEDLANMERILRQKLAEHPELKKALLATGDEEIIEDVTNRPNESGLYWGKIPNGAGQNVLGKMWMAIRADLRKEK